jgi:putative transposase
MSCRQFVADQAAYHPIRLLCRVVGVSRSSFYAWRNRPPSARTQADRALTEQIRAIHQTSRRTYGSPRVQAELRAGGRSVGRRRVARLMRQAGLRGPHGQRRRVRTTVPDRAATPAPDRVERAFAPAQIGAPNRVWFADISYVATRESWLYLAVILDGFSRQVVGWAMADHLRAELVIDALGMAIQRRQPVPGLLHHADHGCQYTSVAFGQRLQGAGIVPSTGSVGDCYDNAVVESFFSSLKTELVDRQVWPSRAAARLAIFEYLEVWYNRQRRHSTLGYLSPTEFEARFMTLANRPAAA